MAKKHYKGSCHCRRVTFEADIDFSEGTSKCNCTSCWKKRWWSVRARPEDFRPLTGEQEMSGYNPGSDSGPSGFCKHCGVLTYARVGVSEWNKAEYVSISVASLDDLDPADLVAAPITYCDGRADNWWNPPAETRHL
jgi:hypothetical protein